MLAEENATGSGQVLRAREREKGGHMTGREFNAGDEAWRAWKTQQAECLLELAARAPRRLSVFRLELASEFKAILNMCVPMPMDTGRHASDERVAITFSSVIEVCCSASVLHEPIPGDRWLSIVHPAHDLFHPHVGAERQFLWTGTTFTRQSALDAMIRGAWSVISMQPGVGFRAAEIEGVLNDHARDYWLTHVDRLPLGDDIDFDESPFLQRLSSRSRREKPKPFGPSGA